MANTLGMAAQLAGQSLRFGWYLALNRALDWRTDQLGKTPRYKPTRPVPTLQQMLADRGAAPDGRCACRPRWALSADG